MTMRVAIIGAGNGGTAMAAHLAANGHEVTLYDKFPRVLEEVKKNKGITLKGVLGEGLFPIKLASTDIAQVIEGVKVLMVVTPAFAHREVAKDLAPFLDEERIIVLHPGRTGGALEFKEVIRNNSPEARPIIAEAQTLLYASRLTGEGEVTVFGLKNRVEFATLPASANEKVSKVLDAIFPGLFIPVENVIQTSLLNIGAVFHPAPTILNAARIEETEGNFEYYHGGISPAVGRILESIDEERMNVARSLGVNTKSALDWLQEVYGAKGPNLYSAIRANKVYGGIKAPPSLETRYISEDVPMSLVPISELGKLTGIPTPVIDAFIKLAGKIHARDYRQEGRTLEKLGIEGMDAKEVMRTVM